MELDQDAVAYFKVLSHHSSDHDIVFLPRFEPSSSCVSAAVYFLKSR